MTKKIDSIRTTILIAALADVPFDGWTWPVVEKAAADAGYDRAMAAAVFPGGLADALDFFSAYIDRLMLARLKDVDVNTLRVRDRIATAVRTRLECLAEHREAERLAVRYWALPMRHVRAGRIAWRTADAIWNWAGDTARDYNRYTKRALLCGVMGSTLLVWLNDDSGSMESVAGFLDRRIENVMQAGRLLGRIRKAA